MSHGAQTDYDRLMWRTFLCSILTGFLPAPVLSCGLALALAVDVSGSVDPGEYRLQMQGLAQALLDATVSEALVRSEAAVMLVQWTGQSRQEVTVPWIRIHSFSDVESLAERISTAPRRWRNFSTAIGDALTFTMSQWDSAPRCIRNIMDVSGDGVSNEGIEPLDAHPALKAAGITVNALAIEGDGTDLTAYFRENVIHGDSAFVVTANSFEDYPSRIRMKLARETAEQIADAEPRIRPTGIEQDRS